MPAVTPLGLERSCPHPAPSGLPAGMPCPWPRCSRGVPGATLRFYGGDELYGGRSVPFYRRWVRTATALGTWTWDTADDGATIEAPLL